MHIGLFDILQSSYLGFSSDTKLLASSLNRYDVDYLSVYLGGAADYESLPFEWRRKAYFRITIVNHLSKKLSVWEGDSSFYAQIDHCIPNINN